MSATRLRESIFPNIPPYLTFIPPDQSYEEGEDCPEELVIHYTVAQWTSLTVRDTIQRFGAKIVEVREKYIHLNVLTFCPANYPPAAACR